MHTNSTSNSTVSNKTRWSQGTPTPSSHTRWRRPAQLLLSMTMSACLSACQLIDMARFSYANANATQQWENAEHSTTIPFTLIDNHIILPVRVNGSEPLNFVLDSGAGTNVIIDSRRSRALQLKMQGELTAAGVGTGPDPVVHIVPDTSLTTGDLSLEGLSVIYLPLDAIPFFDELDHVYFDGVIGAPFFSRFVVEIDYDRGLISFTEPQAAYERIESLGENWREIPLHIKSGVPYIEAQVNPGNDKSIAVKLLMDTGFRGVVSLTPSTHASLEEPTKYFQRVDQGLSGDVINRVAMSESLTLAGYRLHRLPVDYAMAGGETEDGSNGIVGNDVLQQFNIVFDYPNKRLFLTPNENFNAGVAADRSGLLIRPHVDGAVIKSIAPGSTGQSSPLQIGDIITAFDNQAVNYQSIRELKRTLASSGDSVHLCWLSAAVQHCGDLKLASRFDKHPSGATLNTDVR